MATTSPRGSSSTEAARRKTVAVAVADNAHAHAHAHALKTFRLPSLSTAHC
jgi:hypothetical protein